jgi:SAM-dependent methyltransferase
MRLGDAPTAQAPPTFRCNICGQTNPITPLTFQREIASCEGCGSCARFRAVIHVLSKELFGRSIALPDFPVRREVKGLGMSDWDGYASRLAEKLDYVNTYYHQMPRLDICNVDPSLNGRFDFVISSEVFEHVPPPASVAFRNLRRLLKPSGFAVVTVPYRPEGHTIEHFPDLYNYKVIEEGGRKVLHNTTRAGEKQVFDGLVFHGGDGTTLEMRVFSEPDLLAEFERAGFGEAKVYREAEPIHGVGWPERWSLPVAARASRLPG